MPSQEWKERPLQSLDDHGHIRYTYGYAEPGYQDPPSGRVYFGNWNPKEFYFRDEEKAAFAALPRAERNKILGLARVAAFIEKIGGECEWEDEWMECTSCYKAVRTSPTSYGWQPSYVEYYGETTCMNCLFDKKSKYRTAIEYVEYLIDHGTGISADDKRFDIVLRKMGLFDLNEKLGESFETGWYGGQDDDPAKIIKAFKAAGIRSVLRIDSVGQFDSRFSVWIEKGKLREAKKLIAARAHKADIDPAEVLRRNLANVPVVSNKGDGIVVTHIGSTVGDVETRVVSREDFIAGKALDR